MKAFSIACEQVGRVLGALAADELACSFKKHKDFLTIASWTVETALGSGGLDLSGPERIACARRGSLFFGLAPDFLEPVRAERLADWANAIERAIGEELTKLVFTPARRIGEEATIIHAADEIFQDAASAANLLYGRRRLLSLISPHSLLGFELTVVMPNVQRIDVVDARGMASESLSSALSFGDALVATPTLWRYMIREGLSAPDNAMGVIFGETMPPELAIEMRKAGFGAMRELYGSTETGLIGWRDSPTETFVLFDHWRREGDDLARHLPGGGERVIAPMDLLNWDGERGFRLAGRRDGAIQIGAVNIFPDAVADTIRQYQKVSNCSIRVDRSLDGVNRLIAHIVLIDGISPNDSVAQEIDGWCRDNLRPQERPRIYNFEQTLR